MFVIPDKPLIPVDVKSDGIGVVLDAFIINDRIQQSGTSGPNRYDYSVIDITLNAVWPVNGGPLNPPYPLPPEDTRDETGWDSEVERIAVELDQALDDYDQDMIDLLKTHTDKKGAVHGENKETVGLGNKDNFRMGTIEEQKAGVLSNVYVSPGGLREIVESRVKVDPRSYIPARTLPISSGGIFGDVPMWFYDCEVGELQQSRENPIDKFTDTPFQFSTPNGVMIFPSILNNQVQGKYSAPPAGTLPMVYTPWGGTKVRSYNKRIDVRRSRPTYLRGWGTPEYRGDILARSEHMFDPTALYYRENDRIRIRSFNKVSLPFDVLINTAPRDGLFEGIMEYSSEYMFNISASGKVVNGEQRLGFGVLTWKLGEADMEIIAGPPMHAPERVIDTMLNYAGNTITVPAHNRILAVTPNEFQIPFKNLFNATPTIMSDWYAALNKDKLKQISFGWRQRMRMKGSIRTKVGWYNKDGTKYWNGYVDIAVEYTPNPVDRTVKIDVTTGISWNLPLQTMNDNWDMVGDGLFKAYNPSVVNDPMHPAILEGVFESRGGHFKTFTMHNRQYIGYYEHTLTKSQDFNDLGILPVPPITKYSYTAQSTINSTGLYGDHLRHIPVKLDKTGREVTYLTYVRDYRNRYSWALVRINGDHNVIQDRRFGNYIGPDVLELRWLDQKLDKVPSFVMENNLSVIGMNINNLVFNTKNKYKNHLSYTLDETLPEPIVFGKEVVLDPEIIRWVVDHAGSWLGSNKLFFMFRGDLYWINQCTSASEYPVNNIDCYYGVIRDCYVHFDADEKATVKVRGSIETSVSLNSCNMMAKSSLLVDKSTILGLDPFDTQDVYISHSGGDAVAMFNIAPFNNFYVTFDLYKTGGVSQIKPSEVTMSPFKPVGNAFNIDYDKEIAYGTKIPHRLHVNFQSPVMLPNAMWYLDRTPNEYNFMEKSVTTTRKITGGVMGTFKGVNTHPVGSVVTVNGKNTVVKSPMGIKLAETVPYDELFLQQNGTELKLVGHDHNGERATDRSAPVGWINGGEYSYYDPYGWRNASFPVIDGKRMNFFGNGNSFPVLFGKPGSDGPVNRFFLQTQQTVLAWDTAKGRAVPVPSTRNVRVNVNGVEHWANGSQVFNIPVSFTGVVTLRIYSINEIRWAVGLTELREIGSEVMKLDFSSSDAFTIYAPLPKRITSLRGLLKGARGASYPGLENWNVGNVSDFSELLMDTTEFNQILPWNYTNCRSMRAFAKNSKKFNQVITSASNVYNVVDMSEFYMNAEAITLPVSGNFGHCRTIARMYSGTKLFNSTLDGMVLPVCTNIDGLFQNSQAFNQSINALNLPALESAMSVFSGAVAFNKPINVQWGQCRTVRSFFEKTKAFDSEVKMSLPSCYDWSLMFYMAEKFNQPLPAWIFPRGSILDNMFGGTLLFNQPVNFGMSGVRSIASMFRNSKAYRQDIPNWKFSEIEDASYVFANTLFNGKLEGWEWPGEDSDNVITINGMFFVNPAFNQDITYWNTVRIFYMSSVFRNTGPTPSVFNQNVGKWNYINVITLGSFLENNPMFDQDMSGIDIRNCQSLDKAFYKCTKFKSDVSKWKVGNCKNFFHTFGLCRVFNSEMNDLDLSMAETIAGIVRGCVLFNQPVGKWKILNCKDISDVFNGCDIFNQDVSDWPTGAATKAVSTFRSAKMFNQDLSKWPVQNVVDHTDFALDTPVWTLPKPNFPS